MKYASGAHLLDVYMMLHLKVQSRNTRVMAGWLLAQQRERGIPDCSCPGLDKWCGKASSHFPPEKDL